MQMPETTEWFNFGKDSRAVRVLESDEQKWMPVVDIASAIGYDRGGISKILDNNDELFSGMKGNVVTATPGGSQSHVCLNHDGVIGLVMKMNYSRIKDPEKRKRVLEFQRWAVKLLGNVVKGVVVCSPPVAPDIFPHQVKDALRIAAAIAEETHMDLREAQRIALEKLGLGYYAPALPYLPARKDHLISQVVAIPPAPSPKPEGMLSATDIGRIIGKSAEQVNQWFYNNGYIIKDADNPGEWRTDGIDGKTFGTEVPYKPHPAARQVYRVFWYPEILKKFNVKVPDA